MIDYRPKTSKLELHLTYSCDLDCVACSRASFLRHPHTPPMTLEDAEDAFKQADEIGWRPLVILIGGEPTVHKQFLEFARLSREWMNRRNSTGPCSEVQVYSNGYSERARNLCEEAREKYNCSIVKTEWKIDSRIGGEPGQSEWQMGMFVSPREAGLPWVGPCYCHSSEICGVGVDHYGFSICATALSVGAILGDEIAPCRTKRLADLFDLDKAHEMTKAACNHCGYAVGKRGVSVDTAEEFNAYVKTCQKGLVGTPMSEIWRKAFEGRR